MMKDVMEIAVPVDSILTILTGVIHTVASDLWLMGSVVCHSEAHRACLANLTTDKAVVRQNLTS